jgi:hypothetical protein
VRARVIAATSGLLPVDRTRNNPAYPQAPTCAAGVAPKIRVGAGASTGQRVQRSRAIQSSCGPSRYGAKTISSCGDTPIDIMYEGIGPKEPCVCPRVPATLIDFNSAQSAFSPRDR